MIFSNPNKKIPSVELLGDNLKTIRNMENISIKDFAKKISYDRSSYGYLETGSHDIRLSTVVRIAKALNKDVSALFDRSYKDDIALQEKVFVPDDYMAIFARNAKKFCRENKKDICISNIGEIDLERETVSRIINGKMKSANIKTLDAIARLLFNEPLCRFFK